MSKDNEHKIVIYQKGDCVIAKDVITGKECIAKCHPDDEFNFEVGAKIALDRVLEKSPKLCLRYTKDHSSYGCVGTPTPYKDIHKNKLYVGDVVDVYDHINGRLYGSAFVCYDRVPFIMGIKYVCVPSTGDIAFFDVVRKKRYTEIKEGEEILNIEVVKSCD